MARAVIPTLIALQILLTLLTLAPFAGAVSKCTNNCWKNSVISMGCQGATHDDDSDCMCGDEAHAYSVIGYFEFVLCNRDCILTGNWGGLNSYQKCPPVFNDDAAPVLGWGSAEKMQVNVTTRHLQDKPSNPGPATTSEPSSISKASDQGVLIWSSMRSPTTFLTKSKPSSGEILSGIIDRRQIIGLIPWRHDTTTKSTPVQTHNSKATSATIGFCAVPGSSCNEKNVVDALFSSSGIVLTTAVVPEGTPSASAAASATVDTWAAKATSDALQGGATDTTSNPRAPSTLAMYAPNIWAGGPPTTLSVYAPNTFSDQEPSPERTHSVAPSGTCESKGVCGGGMDPGNKALSGDVLK